jgi:hypothetical protein
MDPPDCVAVLRPVNHSVDWFAVGWVQRAIGPDAVKMVGWQVNNSQSWNASGRSASTWCRLVNSRSAIGQNAPFGGLLARSAFHPKRTHLPSLVIPANAGTQRALRVQDVFTAAPTSGSSSRSGAATSAGETRQGISIFALSRLGPRVRGDDESGIGMTKVGSG